MRGLKEGSGKTLTLTVQVEPHRAQRGKTKVNAQDAIDINTTLSYRRPTAKSRGNARGTLGQLGKRNVLW